MNRFKKWAYDQQNILSFSGGKDSTALYLLALKWGFNFRPVFADTGHEHEWTLEFISTLHEKTGGPKIEVIKADFSEQMKKRRKYIYEKWPYDQYTKDGKLKHKALPMSKVRKAMEIMQPTGIPFLDLCILKGRFPSSQARFCTEELKSLPMMFQVMLPALKNGNVISWQGVRAEESRARQNLPRIDMGDGYVIWRPIHHWSVKQVFDLHQEFNLEPNPLYKVGMGRVGCMPCIMCQKSELKEMSERFPEHVERLVEWKRIVGEASKRGISTFFSDDKAPKPEGFEGYQGFREIVEWSKTGRGGKQYDLLNQIEGPMCSSKYGLCE